MTTTDQDQAAPTTYVAVCRLDDIEVEGGVAALVAGEAVAVFRTHDDRVHALNRTAAAIARG